MRCRFATVYDVLMVAERETGPPGLVPADLLPAGHLELDDIEALMQFSQWLSGIVTRSLLATQPQLSLPQLRALVLIRARPAISSIQVAEALSAHPSTASRVVGVLVRRRLVSRVPDPGDRRQVSLTLTPSGQQLAADLMGQRRHDLRQLVDRLEPDARQQVLAAMRLLADASRDPSV